MLILLLLLLWAPVTTADQQQLIDLGRSLFFDVNLSINRNQACASCHNPAVAYSDPAANLSAGAVSLGSDGVSLGDRNAPALTYAAATPEFRRLATDDGGISYQGGFFLDGRAATLQAQATHPLLDPGEMAMPDEQAIVSRIRENASHIQLMMPLLDGSASNTEDADEAVLALAVRALVAFEQSAEFFAFDSKYDRALAGEYTMTADEAIGRELFFSDLTNCRHCHLADSNRVTEAEIFSSFDYHNIGTPPNLQVRSINGRTANYIDPGLAANSATGADPNQRGKYRVPTLRNVAVTAPYMHNGIFNDLETAVLFYGRHLASNTVAAINPETGEPWQPAEIPDTVDNRFLPVGQPLDAIRVRQLVAFLKTLTDRRYEYLLEQP